MNGSTRNPSATATWKDRKSPFFQTGSEIADVFLPHIGPDCFAVYSYLLRWRFKNPELEHTVLELKHRTGLGVSTVCRSLEIISSVGLIEHIRRGGSQKSKCKLCDPEKAAESLGAVYEKRTLSWSLSQEASQRIQAKIEAIRQRQQGKSTQKSSSVSGNRPVRVSQRNAGISPERRQRATRETQTGAHLIQEEVRSKESLTPTPLPEKQCEAEEDKDSPNEDEPDSLLKLAIAKFTGVMNDLGDYLFDTNRPPLPHFANGATEWDSFGFSSLAVETVSWRGEVLMLMLSASDPVAAQRGLEKYHRQWDAGLLKWYKCEVQCEIQQSTRPWWKAK
jgi:hypothetical protein